MIEDITAQRIRQYEAKAGVNKKILLNEAMPTCSSKNQDCCAAPSATKPVIGTWTVTPIVVSAISNKAKFEHDPEAHTYKE